MPDTIFALSSGRPPAGIAVIRVSGPRALEAGERIAGKLPPPKQAALRILRHPEKGDELDQALVLTAVAPHSATGENIVEFQCHGGIAVVSAVLDALNGLHFLREAEGGEFTRQALANGRIDLTEAEGLADLLAAETELQRRVALMRAEGGIRREVEAVRHALLALAAEVELSIDYVDEEDGAAVSVPSARFEALTGQIDLLLTLPSVERLRDGVRAVVAGPPNAGKSSLVNALAREERAIVTAIAGTTRDLIEVPLAIAAVPVILVDTAGLRESEDTVERIGIDRAEEAVERGDIILWLGAEDEAPAKALRVAAKCDVDPSGTGDVRVSVVTGEGLDALRDLILHRARQILPSASGLSLTSRERNCLATARDEVVAAGAAPAPELAADHLRHSRKALDRLSGRAGVEDLLDALFARFCVGK